MAGFNHSHLENIDSDFSPDVDRVTVKPLNELEQTLIVRFKPEALSVPGDNRND
jgi:hypothetical protein